MHKEQRRDLDGAEETADVGRGPDLGEKRRNVRRTRVPGLDRRVRDVLRWQRCFGRLLLAVRLGPGIRPPQADELASEVEVVIRRTPRVVGRPGDPGSRLQPHEGARKRRAGRR
jgi:hypothetical protein